MKVASRIYQHRNFVAHLLHFIAFNHLETNVLLTGLAKGVSMVPRESLGPYFTYFLFSFEKVKRIFGPPQKIMGEIRRHFGFWEGYLGPQVCRDPLDKILATPLVLRSGEVHNY